MKPSIRTPLLALIVACAAGCASHSKDTPEAPKASDANELAVTVLEAGVEPRSPLRYQRVAGRSEQLIIQLGLASFLETRAGTGSDGVVLDLGLKVGAISLVADDVWSYPMTFEVIGIRTDGELSEEERTALLTQLEPLSRVTGVFQVDSRGVTRRADVTVPEGVSPRLLQLLGNVRTSLMSAPFPQEPVGVGARWQVQRPLTVGPIKAVQTTTYTLLERKDAVLRIGLTVEQTAVPQEIALDDQGLGLSLEAYQVSSVGSSVVDLGTITPLGELRGSTEMRATLHHGDQKEPVALGGTLLINVVPVDPAVAP